jgi:Peptide N-acetyl-beta-D-glucosaminyl asparaginase amidase A
VTAGRQFDRTAIVEMGFVNLYFGTTAEPRQNLAPSWHVERDVTDYNALFTNPQSGSVILGNIVNSTYTGIISGSAALEFYPADDHGSSRRVADAVVPLGLRQLLHHRQAARRPPPSWNMAISRISRTSHLCCAISSTALTTRA